MSPPSSQLPYNPVRPRANVHSILKIFSLNRLRTLNHKFDTLFQLSAIFLGYLLVVLIKLYNFAIGPNPLYGQLTEIFLKTSSSVFHSCYTLFTHVPHFSHHLTHFLTHIPHFPRHLPHFSTHVPPFLLIFHSCPVILHTFYSCSTLFPSPSTLFHSCSTLSPSSSTLFHSYSTLSPSSTTLPTHVPHFPRHLPHFPTHIPHFPTHIPHFPHHLPHFSTHVPSFLLI